MDHLFFCFKSYGAQWYNTTGLEGFKVLRDIFDFYWDSTSRSIIQPLALMLFCFVSGISTSFSKSNIKRGLMATGLWAIIFLGSNGLQLLIDNNILSFMAGASVRVDFNIIGVLAFSTLLYCIVEKKSWKALLAGILVLFVFTSFIVPMLRESLVKLCGSWVSHRTGQVYPNGVPNFYMPIFWTPRHQADHVPLLPYAMFFFLGAFVSYFVYKTNKKSIFKHKYNWEKPICFLGRHTLIIYISHYIILNGIFLLIGLFIR